MLSARPVQKAYSLSLHKENSAGQTNFLSYTGATLCHSLECFIIGGKNISLLMLMPVNVEVSWTRKRTEQEQYLLCRATVWTRVCGSSRAAVVQ